MAKNKNNNSETRKFNLKNENNLNENNRQEKNKQNKQNRKVSKLPTSYRQVRK